MSEKKPFYKKKKEEAKRVGKNLLCHILELGAIESSKLWWKNQINIFTKKTNSTVKLLCKLSGPLKAPILSSS